MATKAEIQRLRSLRERKHREALGLYVVEGEKVVSELLAANWKFDAIYSTESWPGIRTHTLTADEMSRASHFPTPSSVLALGRMRQVPIQSSDLTRGITLLLDGVQDPGNVGTIIRIADWFGIDRVVLSMDSADLFNQKTINSSMGSFARVPVHRTNLHPLVSACGVPIYGCTLKGGDFHQVAGMNSGILAIGSEGRGLSAEIQSLVSREITIPKFGHAESLNAAVATGIICATIKCLPSNAGI